jgi:hypothetical protein
MTLHVACFFCEAGIIACTMTNLFAGDDPSLRDRASRSSELTMSIVSILSTCVSFTVTQIGPGRIITWATKAVERVSQGGAQLGAVLGERSCRKSFGTAAVVQPTCKDHDDAGSDRVE